MKMNPVVHFEMPYEDKNRMAEFYGKAFGWKTQFFGSEMGNYVTVMTSEQEKTPGAIHGGFHEKTSDMSACPSVVIAVDDIEESVQKVKELGGEVLGHPVEIPGVGMYVGVLDTEGNRVSMLQPKEM